ncbi:hypothetical protein BH09GEM1_BH09GEM1_07510 [soil metagenome]
MMQTTSAHARGTRPSAFAIANFFITCVRSCNVYASVTISRAVRDAVSEELERESPGDGDADDIARMAYRLTGERTTRWLLDDAWANVPVFRAEAA